MSVEPSQELMHVQQSYTVRQSQEPGVVISERQYRRLIDRLDGCKPHGWSDLWLAGSGIGGGLVVSALVAFLTLPATITPADKGTLLMLVVMGSVILFLCLVAYLTQRRHQGDDIDELRRDFAMQMPQRSGSPASCDSERSSAYRPFSSEGG